MVYYINQQGQLPRLYLFKCDITQT